MDRYVTKDGDSVDLICWRVYGQQASAAEAVLAANPGLAARGPVLEAGIVVRLPDAPKTNPSTTIRLWD
jgi:phage tail protein X